MTLILERSSRVVRFCCVLLIVTVACAGCASAVEGRKQQVAISSEPPGASVIVDGTNVATTPAEIELGRRKSHSVRIEKVGYVAYETTTTSHFTNWQWIDVIPALIFAPMLLVLYFDDGAYEVVPHEITAKLIAAPTASNPLDPVSTGEGTSADRAVP
jgi:hypothetical protein